MTIRTIAEPFSIPAVLLAAVLAGTPAAGALAQTALPPVSIIAEEEGYRPASAGTLEAGDLDKARPFSTDTTTLLRWIDGAEAATGGGVSSLPVLRGQADDRNKVLIDGIPVTAACPNHMNPATSYIDPSRVGRITAVAGVTPVSQGGDSIGGTLTVDSPVPVFAETGAGLHTEGRLSSFYRSNGDALGGSLSGSAATETLSLGYTGSLSSANSYEDGHGDTIVASKYSARNHAATLGVKTEDGVFTLKGGQQYIPYEGFPNQYMDMLWNRSKFLNGSYEGDFSWGRLKTRLYWQETKHYMDFLTERRKSGTMPMYTEGRDKGYAVHAEIPLTAADTLRLGNELHDQALDDWWPAVAGSMMMGPDTFLSINDGKRTRLGSYAEWERNWSRSWTSLLGVRNDTVWMDAGPVQGYNAMGTYAADASAFNNRDRSKTDVNIDLSALVRYEPGKTETYEGGLARKVRSPNLYERYAWSTGGMASRMINWFGDGNGYVGDVDLKPETAYIASLSGGWHDAARNDWSVTVTPYVSYVANYIDADRIGELSDGYGLFRFANHDAILYGADFSARKKLAEDVDLGRFDLVGKLGWVHGNRVNGDGLYRMIPLNLKLSLEHKLGNWGAAIDTQFMSRADNVSSARTQPKTPGYALVGLRGSYEIGSVRFDVGVDNLFDKQYYHPLGGVYLSEGAAAGTPLASPGRSFNAGVTVTF